MKTTKRAPLTVDEIIDGYAALGIPNIDGSGNAWSSEMEIGMYGFTMAKSPAEAVAWLGDALIGLPCYRVQGSYHYVGPVSTRRLAERHRKEL